MIADEGCVKVEAESKKMIPAEEKAKFIESVCLEEEARSLTKMTPGEEKAKFVESVCLEEEARSTAIEKLPERGKLESKGKTPTLEEYIPPGGFHGSFDFKKLGKAKQKVVYDILDLGIKWYNKKQNANLKFVKLVKVYYEIVAGFLYYVTFRANDGSKTSVYQCKAWRKSTSPKVEARTGKQLENVVLMCRKKPSAQGRGCSTMQKPNCEQGCSCEECNGDFGLEFIFA